MGAYDPSKLRYNLFTGIARRTWQRVANAHAVGANLDERGITADIIVEILTFYNKYKGKAPSIGLFAAKGQDEDIYGSDMDIFFHIKDGKYVWFALQAKLLKVGDKYTSLGDKKQWNKLAKLEVDSGCKAFYLLYNGKRNYDKKDLIDRCRISFIMEDFGCSLVEPDFVEKQVGLGRKSFGDFHNTPAQPWRVLMMCPMDLFKSPPKYGAELKKYATFAE